MKHYELLCVLPGTLGDNEVAPVATAVQTILTEGGAEEVKEYDHGKSRLAYPMKHIRYGYFRVYRFNCEPDKVPSIEAKLRLTDNLLRSLIQIADPETDPTDIQQPAPTPDVKKAGSGEDRTLPEMASAPTAKKQAAKKKEKEEEATPVSIDNIGEKLDEILDQDIANV